MLMMFHPEQLNHFHNFKNRCSFKHGIHCNSYSDNSGYHFVFTRMTIIRDQMKSEKFAHINFGVSVGMEY